MDHWKCLRIWIIKYIWYKWTKNGYFNLDFSLCRMIFKTEMYHFSAYSYENNIWLQKFQRSMDWHDQELGQTLVPSYQEQNNLEINNLSLSFVPVMSWSIAYYTDFSCPGCHFSANSKFVIWSAIQYFISVDRDSLFFSLLLSTSVTMEFS